MGLMSQIRSIEMSLPLYVVPATEPVVQVEETDGGVRRMKWRWSCPRCSRVTREPATVKRSEIEADALCVYCRIPLGDPRVKIARGV